MILLVSSAHYAMAHVSPSSTKEWMEEKMRWRHVRFSWCETLSFFWSDSTFAKRRLKDNKSLIHSHSLPSLLRNNPLKPFFLSLENILFMNHEAFYTTNWWLHDAANKKMENLFDVNARRREWMGKIILYNRQNGVSSSIQSTESCDENWRFLVREQQFN